MIQKVDKIFFIPNWNGHLYIQYYNDNSVNKIFKIIDFDKKKKIEIIKNDIDYSNNLIETIVKENLNKKLLFIAGDHSNTYSLFRAFSSNKKKSKLIIFDAHPDVEVDTGKPSHEDYVRCLIDEGIVLPENVYMFGLRTFSRTEFEYLEEKGVNYMTIVDILKDKNKVKSILKEINEDIYVSLDIDVLDPDFAPGTYYKEWCGLTIDELIYFISLIKDKALAIDICEFYLEKDEDEITQKNVVRLVEEVLEFNN